MLTFIMSIICEVIDYVKPSRMMGFHWRTNTAYFLIHQKYMLPEYIHITYLANVVSIFFMRNWCQALFFTVKSCQEISNVTYVDVVIRCCVTIIIINRKRKDVGSSWKIKNHPIFGALLDNTSVLLCCRLCSSSIW